MKALLCDAHNSKTVSRMEKMHSIVRQVYGEVRIRRENEYNFSVMYLMDNQSRERERGAKNDTYPPMNDGDFVHRENDIHQFLKQKKTRHLC